MARASATRTRGHHLDSRRRSPDRERRASRDHPRDGARPAHRRRRRAPDHVPSARRQGLVDMVPRRRLARLQHAPERPRGRVHRAATIRRAPTTTARRSSRCSTASRSTRITRSRSTPTKLGHSIAADVRRPLYWDLFTGAFGHTYGHHSVWQMWTPGRASRSTTRSCRGIEAIDQPGAAQMQHARALLESRPFLTRIPDRRRHRHGPRPDERAGRGALSVRRHARRGRQLRDGLCAGRPDVHRAHEQDHRAQRRRRGGSIRGPARRRAIGTFPNTGERDVHAAGSRRDARLGAGARRRVEEVSAAWKNAIARGHEGRPDRPLPGSLR